MATNVQLFTITECSPLLPQPASTHQKKKRSCFPKLKYRLPKISEKGAVFMIIWNFLFMVSFFSTSSEILEWRESYIIEYTVIMSLFVFIGLLADCWVGRYRILRMSMYLLLVGVIIKTTDTLVIATSIPALLYMTIACQALSGVCYGACTIQFTMDQLIGAS